MIIGATKPLKTQLAAVGYKPSDITYLGLSHYHSDHTANANDFAGSTWLVHQEERDFMFNPPPQAPVMSTASFSALKDAKTTIIKTDDYDVFGDKTVITGARLASYARPSGAVPEARQDRSRAGRRRPLSLPGRSAPPATSPRSNTTRN